MNYLEIDKTSRDKIANVINKNFFVDGSGIKGFINVFNFKHWYYLPVLQVL